MKFNSWLEKKKGKIAKKEPKPQHRFELWIFRLEGGRLHQVSISWL